MRAARVNERSELILILILISTSILTLILISTLISTSLFPSPSIVSPFPFQKREICVFEKSYDCLRQVMSYERLRLVMIGFAKFEVRRAIIS